MITNVVSAMLFIVIAGTGGLVAVLTEQPVPAIVGVIVGVFAAMSPRVAQQWERAIVLRLGRFVGLRGPGLFWIVPFIDTVPRLIDQRVVTTGFAPSSR